MAYCYSTVYIHNTKYLQLLTTTVISAIKCVTSSTVFGKSHLKSTYKYGTFYNLTLHKSTQLLANEIKNQRFMHGHPYNSCLGHVCLRCAPDGTRKTC